MNPKDFEELVREKEEVSDNVEFLTSFVIRENGTQEMLEELLKFYDESTISAIVDYYADIKEFYAYQGFDPARLIVHLMKVHQSWKEKNEKAADEVVSVITDKIKIKKHEEFTKEMSLLIMLFLIRGSNVKKIAMKSVTSMSKLIKFYSGKYTLVSKDDRKGDLKDSLKPDSVTLARIASCFPMMTVTLFHRDIGRTLCPVTKYFKEMIPKVILSPGFAAVIPKDIPVDESIHHVIIYINYCNDRVINQNKKDKTTLESLVTYHKAAFNSPTMSESLRVKVCENVEIMIDGKFTAFLLQLEKEAIAMLAHLEGSDTCIPITY